MAPAATPSKRSRESFTPVKVSPKLTRKRGNAPSIEPTSASVEKTPIKTPSKVAQKARKSETPQKPQQNGRKSETLQKPQQNGRKSETPQKNGRKSETPQKPQQNGRKSETPIKAPKSAPKQKPTKATQETLDQIVTDIEKSEKFVDEVLEEQSGSSDSGSAEDIATEETESSSAEEMEEISDESSDEPEENQKSILKKSEPLTEKQNEKHVSFTAQKSEKEVKAKVDKHIDPSKLNGQFALTIKGLNFKCTADDIKKRLPEAIYVRLPASVTKPNQNNGYCITYFADKAKCDAAYKSLREQPKILSRDCFVTYYQKAEMDKATRETDTTTLYISNFPRQKNVTSEQVMKVFPDAKYIFLKQIHARCIMFVKFSNSVAASAYLKKNVHFGGQKLNVSLSFKERSTAQPEPAKKAAPKTKEPATKKSKVEPVEQVESSEEEEDVEDSSSADDEVSIEDIAGTDSEDESSE